MSAARGTRGDAPSRVAPVTRRDRLDLLLLGAIWGASFLFMRVGAEPFGPVAMVFVRVAGAALVLLPLLLWRGECGELRRHWRAIFWVGLMNSALPFLLFGFALLHVTGSLAAVFNAATPLFGAAIAWAWLGERLDRWRVVGLVVGFSGVFGLAFEQAGFRAGVDGWRGPLAVGACLLAAVSYGYSASFARRHLADVAPIALATGSQLAATVALAVPAAAVWPGQAPSPVAWASVIALAIICTGLAYLLFFRLIARTGTANALTVTYLVPAFAVAWGAALLGERPTASMLGGCALILGGTALATGWIGPRQR